MLINKSQRKIPTAYGKKAHKHKKPVNTLIDAVMVDDATKIRQLMKEGADVNLPMGPAGETALHFAALFNKEKAVAALIEMKADVNATTTNQQMPQPAMARGRPMHSAALRGNYNIIKLLIEAKAKVDCYDEVGDTPLHNAV